MEGFDFDVDGLVGRLGLFTDDKKEDSTKTTGELQQQTTKSEEKVQSKGVMEEDDPVGERWTGIIKSTTKEGDDEEFVPDQDGEDKNAEEAGIAAERKMETEEEIGAISLVKTEDDEEPLTKKRVPDPTAVIPPKKEEPKKNVQRSFIIGNRDSLSSRNKESFKITERSEKKRQSNLKKKVESNEPTREQILLLELLDRTPFMDTKSSSRVIKDIMTTVQDANKPLFFDFGRATLGYKISEPEPDENFEFIKRYLTYVSKSLKRKITPKFPQLDELINVMAGRGYVKNGTSVVRVSPNNIKENDMFPMDLEIDQKPTKEEMKKGGKGKQQSIEGKEQPMEEEKEENAFFESVSNSIKKIEKEKSDLEKKMRNTMSNINLKKQQKQSIQGLDKEFKSLKDEIDEMNELIKVMKELQSIEEKKKDINKQVVKKKEEIDFLRTEAKDLKLTEADIYLHEKISASFIDNFLKQLKLTQKMNKEGRVCYPPNYAALFNTPSELLEDQFSFMSLFNKPSSGGFNMPPYIKEGTIEAVLSKILGDQNYLFIETVIPPKQGTSPTIGINTHCRNRDDTMVKTVCIYMDVYGRCGYSYTKLARGAFDNDKTVKKLTIYLTSTRRYIMTKLYPMFNNFTGLDETHYELYQAMMEGYKKLVKPMRERAFKIMGEAMNIVLNKFAEIIESKDFLSEELDKKDVSMNEKKEENDEQRKRSRSRSMSIDEGNNPKRKN